MSGDYGVDTADGSINYHQDGTQTFQPYVDSGNGVPVDFDSGVNWVVSQTGIEWPGARSTDTPSFEQPSTFTSTLNNDIPVAAKIAEASGKSFFDQALGFLKNKENSNILALGGLFMKGVFSAPAAKKAAEAAAKNADANMLNATSNDAKWRQQMANASAGGQAIDDAFGKTNFGTGLMYHDVLAERKARNGG